MMIGILLDYTRPIRTFLDPFRPQDPPGTFWTLWTFLDPPEPFLTLMDPTEPSWTLQDFPGSPWLSRTPMDPP